MHELIKHESGFRPGAANGTSGACGIYQAYPCSKLLAICPDLSDIDCQNRFGIDYIKRRYGTPSKAWEHWQARVAINGKDVGNWY